MPPYILPRTFVILILVLLAGCAASQPIKKIPLADEGKAMVQSFFVPEVLNHALHHDKGIHSSSLFGQSADDVLIVPDRARYFPEHHLYVFTYYPVGCHGNYCNFTGLYSEPGKRFFTLDTDDYAFWVDDADLRDDEQLKAFLDSTGVQFRNEFLLSSFLEHIFGFNLESGLPVDSVASRLEARYRGLQQAAYFRKPEGSTWSREDIIRHAESSRKDAISQAEHLQQKGYFIQWDFSFRDGTIVLVYIHPKDLMDFGILYF